MSGNIGDAIKYGKIAIFPENYANSQAFIIPENTNIEEQLVTYGKLMNDDFCNTTMYSTLMMSLGNGYNAIGYFYRSLDYYQKGLELVQVLYGKYYSSYAECLGNIALINLRLKKFQTSFQSVSYTHLDVYKRQKETHNQITAMLSSNNTVASPNKNKSYSIP